MLLWSGDYGLDLFNTRTLTEEQQRILEEYWTRFEDHVKPQANHILKRYYLRGLKQNNRPLATFQTEARYRVLVTHLTYMSQYYSQNRQTEHGKD